jgi:hypothetical protein
MVRKSDIEAPTSPAGVPDRVGAGGVNSFGTWGTRHSLPGDFPRQRFVNDSLKSAMIATLVPNCFASGIKRVSR